MADWYYAANGRQVGPVDAQTLRQMLAAASLSSADLVYGPGLTQWTPAGQVPALASPVEGVRDTGAVQAGPATAAMSAIGYQGVHTDQTGLSEVALAHLRGTKPWVRFISVMTLISAGLMVVLGILALIAMPLAGVVYIAVAGLYLVPYTLLKRYADAIAALTRTQRMGDVECALIAQKSFWKFSGVMLIVVLCIYAAVIVGVVLWRLR
jgi:hypothetical protein